MAISIIKPLEGTTQDITLYIMELWDKTERVEACRHYERNAFIPIERGVPLERKIRAYYEKYFK